MNELIIKLKLAKLHTKNWLKKFGLWILAILVPVVGAAPFVGGPTSLTPGDSGVLRASITASQTTLTIDPIKKYVNGVETTGCFNTGSGVLLLADSLGRKEWASFWGNSCSSNVTTLSNLTRGLDPTNPTYTGGTGLAFDAGTRVTVIDWAGYYNDAVYKNAVNVTSGSGSIECGGTANPCLFIGQYTTAQRDAFTYIKDGAIILNTTLGVAQFRSGSAWVSFGSGGDLLASLTQKGDVQIASTGSISSNAVFGSTNAFNALTVLLVTRTSTGSTQANKIPALDENGRMSGSLLASGTPSATNFLRGDQEWSAINSTTSLTNSGNLIVDSYATGSLLTVKHTNAAKFTIKGSQDNFHIVTSGSTPTLGGCAGATITGNDIAGRITNPTSPCSMYFAKPYENGATNVSCVFTAQDAGAASDDTIAIQSYSSTGVTIVDTTGAGWAAGADPTYFCVGF